MSPSTRISSPSGRSTSSVLPASRSSSKRDALVVLVGEAVGAGDEVRGRAVDRSRSSREPAPSAFSMNWPTRAGNSCTSSAAPVSAAARVARRARRRRARRCRRRGRPRPGRPSPSAVGQAEERRALARLASVAGRAEPEARAERAGRGGGARRLAPLDPHALQPEPLEHRGAGVGRDGHRERERGGERGEAVGERRPPRAAPAARARAAPPAARATAAARSGVAGQSTCSSRSSSCRSAIVIPQLGAQPLQRRATGATSPCPAGRRAPRPSRPRTARAGSGSRSPAGRPRAAGRARASSAARRSPARSAASGEGAASPDGCSSPAARSASAARRPADAAPVARLVGDDRQQPRPQRLAGAEAARARGAP